MLILCINIQFKRYSLKGLRDSATSLVNVNTRCMDEAWNQSSHPHSNTFLFFLSVTRPQMNYLRWLWMGCQRDTRFLKLFQQTQAGGKLRMNPLHFWRAQCGECCLWMDSECEASAKRKQEIAWNRWNDWLTALLFSSGMFALKTQNCALWQIWLSLLTLVHHLCLLHYFFPIMLFLLIEHQAREMCTVAVFFNGHPTWLDVYLWDLESSVGICSVSNQIRDHTGTQGDCVGILAPLCGTPIWLCAKKITSQPVALPLWPPPPVTTFSSFIEPTTQPGKDWGVRWVLVWLCGTQRPQEAL